MSFTLLRSGARCRNASAIHQLLMGCNSSQSVRFRVELLSGPDSLSEGAGTNPDFHVMDVLIAEFAPEADLSAEDILLVIVVLDQFADVLIVEIHPCEVVAVADAKVVAHAHVQVERTILRDYDLIGCHREASSPPMNYITVFDLDVVGVHPVDKLSGWVEFLQNFVLFFAIVSLDLLLAYGLLGYEFGFVGEAGQDDFVSSQMHQWVREYVKNLRKHLPDQLVGFIQRHVQGAHEPLPECTGHTLVLRSQPPASCVSRRIQLRHYPYSSSFCVLNNLPRFFGCVGLLGRVRRILRNFRVRIQYQGKGIFVNDVPVQNIHLIVHHRVNSFINEPHRQKVSGRINHETSVRKSWHIFNHQRQVVQRTGLRFMAGTPNRLHEGLQSSNEAYIRQGIYLCTAFSNLQLVFFLNSPKHRLQLRILNADLNCVVKLLRTDFQVRRNDDVGVAAAKSLLHLKTDQLSDVLVAVLITFKVEKHVAWL